MAEKQVPKIRIVTLEEKSSSKKVGSQALACACDGHCPSFECGAQKQECGCEGGPEACPCEAYPACDCEDEPSCGCHPHQCACDSDSSSSNLGSRVNAKIQSSKERNGIPRTFFKIAGEG